jgi:type IV pilus assembly protein PilC
MQYSYEAKDTSGQTISGSLEAESERAAASRVREMGFYPMRLVPAQGTIRRVSIPLDATQSPSSAHLAGNDRLVRPIDRLLRAFVYPVYTGVSLQTMSVFYRQLAAMLTAGVPLQRSLATLSEQHTNAALRRAIHGLHQQVLAGQRLSEGMLAFPHLFSTMQVEFVASSELTGGLGPMMNQLADYLEAEDALRKMVNKETFQPKMTFVLSFLLPNLVVAVVSGAQAYFESAVKPLIELLLMGGLLVGGFRYGLQSKPIAFVYDTVKSYLPYFGKTVRMLAIAKFSRALAALYTAGVAIPAAMEISSRVAGNQYLSSLIMRAVDSVKAGSDLSTAFSSTGVFPPMFLSMVHTGEETGNLDGMLHKVADFFEGDAQLRLQQSVKVLTTLMFLIVAAIVGVIVIRFYTNMFGAALNIGE